MILSSFSTLLKPTFYTLAIGNTVQVICYREIQTCQWKICHYILLIYEVLCFFSRHGVFSKQTILILSHMSTRHFLHFEYNKWLWGKIVIERLKIF